MEKSQLVETITRELMKMAASGDLASLAAPGPGAPAPMPMAATACLCGTRPLLAVAGNPLTAPETERTFARLRQVYDKPKVVLSPSAEKLFSGARRCFAGFQLFGDQRDFAAELEGFDHCIILNTTVNLVSKMAHLIADSVVSVAAFQMLSRGKPVYLTTDSLQSWFFNAAIENEVRGNLRKLSSYGICVITSEMLFGGGPGSGIVDTSACGCALGGADCASCGLCATRSPEAVKAILGSGASRVGAAPGLGAVDGRVASMIDHTLLKADATEEQVRTLCKEAAEYTFASVCVNPGWVRLAAELLAGTPVKVCTVIGFPLGATTSAAKACETRDAIANGADEIDMVINVGALKAKDYARVRDDIRGVVQAASGRIVKVILETALLSDDEKRKACELSVEAGADFVKTSTGFGPGGATVGDIALMRSVVGPNIGVKASGGIRDAKTAQAMVEAGATRIGASASVAIAQGKDAGEGKY